MPTCNRLMHLERGNMDWLIFAAILSTTQCLELNTNMERETTSKMAFIQTAIRFNSHSNSIFHTRSKWINMGSSELFGLILPSRSALTAMITLKIELGFQPIAGTRHLAIFPRVTQMLRCVQGGLRRRDQPTLLTPSSRQGIRIINWVHSVLSTRDLLLRSNKLLPISSQSDFSVTPTGSRFPSLDWL